MIGGDIQIYTKYVFDHLSIKMEVNFSRRTFITGGQLVSSSCTVGLNVYQDFVRNKFAGKENGKETCIIISWNLVGVSCEFLRVIRNSKIITKVFLVK